MTSEGNKYSVSAYQSVRGETNPSSGTDQGVFLQATGKKRILECLNV